MSLSKTVIVGLSGPSSSGKTTLARLLRQIFNVSVPVSASTSPSPKVVTNGVAYEDESLSTHRGVRSRIGRVKLFILHEDDFYKTDTLIPRKSFTSAEHGTRELEDWDCVESLDLPLLSSTLRHIKDHGVLPPEMVSKEDQNSVGESGVPDSTVEGLHSGLASWLSLSSAESKIQSEGVDVTICVLDGFLLYSSPDSAPGSQRRDLAEMMDAALDAKLFIPSTRAKTIERRTKRTGYVTLEGFWEDPPGYVEDVVWPNFREDHGWLFGSFDGRGDGEEKGNRDAESMKRVDKGLVDRGVAKANGISVGPGSGEVHLRDILPWATERVKKAVESKLI